MKKKKASQKKPFRTPRKKVICLKTPEISVPINRLNQLQTKVKQWFASLHRLLVKAEKKIFTLLQKIAQTIRRYWECLMLPTEILILFLRKIKEQNLLACNEN